MIQCVVTVINAALHIKTVPIWSYVLTQCYANNITMNAYSTPTTLTPELVHATATVHCQTSATQVLLLLLLPATTAAAADDIDAAAAAHRCILHMLRWATITHTHTNNVVHPHPHTHCAITAPSLWQVCCTFSVLVSNSNSLIRPLCRQA